MNERDASVNVMTMGSCVHMASGTRGGEGGARGGGARMVKCCLQTRAVLEAWVAVAREERDLAVGRHAAHRVRA